MEKRRENAFYPQKRNSIFLQKLAVFEWNHRMSLLIVREAECTGMAWKESALMTAVPLGYLAKSRNDG